MGGTPAAFSDAFEPSAFQAGEVEVVAPPTYGGGHSGDYERRVRAWWERIEAIRAENREREAAERVQQHAIEARRQALAEIEAERSRRRRKAAQRARDEERAAIQAEIAAAELRAAALSTQIEQAIAEIARLEAEIAAAEQARLEFLRRRNAALALILIAA